MLIILLLKRVLCLLLLPCCPQFLNALSMCAEKKGVSFEEMVRGVLTTGGPVAHATRPDNVRLHDDKVRCGCAL